MPDSTDHHRTLIAVGDAVRFTYRRKTIEGTVARTNPKRAVVRAGKENYQVPYEVLTPLGDTAEKRIQRISQIEQLANRMLARHHLRSWSFRFDHATRRAGCCNYRDKTITISFDLAQRGSDADIRDTILHEVAHAIVGKKHNHDAVWKAKAMEIGCSGERTHRLEFSPPKWTVRCENDCWSHTAHRRNHRLVCRTCGGKLVYSAYR